MQRLSYVILSYNRVQTVLGTLGRLREVTPLREGDWDIWVVDNASTDGSADAIARQFPLVNLIRNRVNEGMYARNLAIARCRGQYIICLDDDSYPNDPHGVSLALNRLDADPQLAALVARVVLRNGSEEAPAFPAVMMGGATCLRKSAIEQVGGFRKEFFRQAEEYDLSFRLWGAGFSVGRCESMVVLHENAGAAEPAGQASALVHRMDVRNHIMIADRFLPYWLRDIYVRDWSLRYSALARQAGHQWQAWMGRRSAQIWRLRHCFTGRQILSMGAIENIFGLRRQTTAVGDWARRHGVWRVAIADFGMNLYATYNAAVSNGLQVRVIADENPAYAGLKYRALPIAPLSRALEGGGIEGIIVSNINPAQVEARVRGVGRAFKGPVLQLWHPTPALATHASAA